LKPPGFNPCAYGVKSWFQSLLSSNSTGTATAWGYNTAAERARAAGNPRITLIGIDAFVAMLRAAAAA
jgi:hypothetical protein